MSSSRRRGHLTMRTFYYFAAPLILATIIVIRIVSVEDVLGKMKQGSPPRLKPPSKSKISLPIPPKIVLFHCPNLPEHGVQSLRIWKTIFSLVAARVNGTVEVTQLSKNSRILSGASHPATFFAVYSSTSSRAPRCSDDVPQVRNIYESNKVDKLSQTKIALISQSGEVFAQHSSCGGYDAVLDRRLNRERQGCASLHYIQGITHSWARRAPPSEYFPKALNKKRFSSHKNATHFCILAASATIKGVHLGDGLVRMAFWWLLSQASGIHCHGTSFMDELRLGALARGSLDDQRRAWNMSHVHPPFLSTSAQVKMPGIDLDAWKYMRDYRFALNMENSQIEGYVSEKLVSGMLAGALPVYFGAPDVGKYFNPEAFLSCRLSDDVIEKLRIEKPVRYNVFRGGSREQRGRGKLELVEWAVGLLRDELKPCIDAVLRISQDSTAYDRMVRQPAMLMPEQKSTLDGGPGLLRSAARILCNKKSVRNKCVLLQNL